MMDWLNQNPSILTLISVLVIFTGWGVIFRNSKKITDRNETHAILRSLIDKTERLLQEGTRFWIETKDDQNFNLAMTRLFINSISHIKSDLKLLEERNLNVYLLSPLVRIRSSLTLDSEEAHKVAFEDRINKIDELTDATEALKRHCYIQYIRQHPLTK